MITIGEKALAIALSKLGEREQGGPNQGPIVEWSLAGLTRRPPDETGWAKWCAFFVCQCYLRAAQDADRHHFGKMAPPPRRVLRFASGDCDRLWHNLSLEDPAQPWTWLAISPEARTPPDVRPGCLIFLGGHGDIQHVSFVHRLENGWVEELGGNIGDAVRLRRRPFTDPTIYGYAEVRLS